VLDLPHCVHARSEYVRDLGRCQVEDKPQREYTPLRLGQRVDGRSHTRIRVETLESLYRAALGLEPDGVTKRRVLLSETKKRLDVLATGIEIAMAIELQAGKGEASVGDLRAIDVAHATLGLT
jgi:hypothetical protein